MGRRARGALAALAVAGALVLWFASRLGPPPLAAAPPGLAQPRHPDDLTSLVDQEGRPFSFVPLRGRTVVVSFIFTHCPSSCPLQTVALAAVQRALPADLASRVAFVSVSIDPARDTPAALKRFASSKGADLSTWSFVGGSADETASLDRYFGVQARALAGGQLDHRVAVYLLDPNHRLAQTYAGEPLDQRRLVQEIGVVDSLFNKT